MATKNPAGKTRKLTDAYAWWVDPRTGWRYHLLKSWQSDNAKPYARWFIRVEGYGDDCGDAYCTEVTPPLHRAVRMAEFDGPTNGFVWYDDSVWSSLEQFLSWVEGENGCRRQK